MVSEEVKRHLGTSICRKCGKPLKSTSGTIVGRVTEKTRILQDTISGVIYPEDHLRSMKGNRQRYGNLRVVVAVNLTEESGLEQESSRRNDG